MSVNSEVTGPDRPLFEAFVLGPVGLARDGVPIDIGGPKPTLLLALLLSAAGDVVGVETLIDGLWGDDPPATARKAVQVHVSNLRRALGEDFPLETVAGGYVITQHGLDVDATLFEADLAAATASLRRDPIGAGEAAARALARWRGPAYAGLQGADALQGEVHRLTELRHQSNVVRLEARLLLGQHADVVGELDALATEHPYREDLRRLHMVALYRSGRQTDALRAFERTRDRLRDDLGLDPSPALRSLQQRILDQAPDLDLDPSGPGEQVVLLATDIAGSTELWKADPDAMSVALARHDELVAAAIGAYTGDTFEHTGDGVVAVFEHAESALGAAVRIQRDLAAEPWETESPIRVRIGVDRGVAVARDGDYFGRVVNRVASIMSSGHGGQIVAHESLTGAAPDGARPLGSADLKGVGRVGLVQVDVDGLVNEFPELRTDRSPSPFERKGFDRAVRGFELREQLGEGAHSIVYRAYQASVGREVAVKVIRPEHANQPGFVKRFEAEAQYVARLEHPHIVPLYDYWRDPEGAYLVMQWVRAGSLAHAVASGPWEPPATMRMLDQVGAALSYAHRHGVLHRDIKPANVLLDGEGNAYLTDFGIASQQARPASNGLSSAVYVAPEELANQPVGPSADLYAFALLANEVLTGTRPRPGRQAESVATTRPALPTALDAVFALATDTDPGRRYERVEDFLRALRQVFGSDVVTRDLVTDTETRNPYKGLRAFAETDAADYFGRDGLVDHVVAQVAASPLTVVVGPSGSGKSSLVKAGVLPALRTRGIASGVGDVRGALITEMFPGSYPFEELEAALIRVAVDRPSGLLTDLIADDRGLLRVSKQILPDDDTDLILVIDQFEELFSLTTDDEVRRLFLANLTALAADERSRVRVVATIRADFFDRPLAYSEFGALMSASLVTVAIPSETELAAAIAEPARNAGLEIEPGLIPLIIRDVADEPGALPLMQYTLTELVGEREGRLLTIDAYERSGGVVGSLARRAEEIFAGLPANAQTVAEELFVHLVVVDEESDDTRRRVRRTELDSLGLGTTALDTVLADFGSFRLLTFDHDPVTRGQTIEVAHEALIREWPRLRNWIDARREGLILQRRLQLATQDWIASRREPSFLFGGGRLDQYELWAGATNVRLTDDELAFLDESRRTSDDDDRRASRRRRSVLALVGSLAVVAIVVAAVALVQRRRADESAVEAAAAAAAADEAAIEAEDLRVEADAAAGDADEQRARAEALRIDAEHLAAVETARVTGLEASRLAATEPGAALAAAVHSADQARALDVTLPETMRGLWDATRRHRPVSEFDGAQFFHFTGHVAGASPDGTRAVVTVPLTNSEDSEAVTRVHELSTGEVLQEFGPSDAIHSTWDPYTDEIIITTEGGEIQWWDPDSVELLRSDRAEGGPVWYLEVTEQHIGYSRVQNPSNGVSTVVIADKVSGDDVVRIEDAYWARLSPGGRFASVLVTAGQLLVIDVRDGTEVMRIDHGLDRYIAGSSIEWIGEDDRLLLPRPDGTIAHVDVVTGSIVDPYPNTLVGVVPIAISSSPDGRFFAEADSDSSVRVYETDSHRELLRLDGHEIHGAGVRWVGSDRLISMDSSGRVIVWDLAPPSASAVPFVSAPDFPVYHDLFDDRYVMLSSRRARVQVWDTLNEELVIEFDIGDELQDLSTVTHTELALIAAPAESGIRVYDVRRRAWVLDVESEALDHPLAFSPDGRYLLASSWYAAIDAGTTGRAATALLDVATGQEVWRMDGAMTVAGEFLPDGATVVLSGPRDVSHFDFATRFVDVSTGEIMGDQRVFTSINDLAVSPDGSRVVIRQNGVGDWNDTRLVVYDVERAMSEPFADAVVGTHDIGARGGVKFIDYSPDGSTLFAGSTDGVLRALDAVDFEPLWSIENGLVMTELRFDDGLLRFAVQAGLPVGLGGGPYGVIGIPYEQSAFADWARSLTT